MYSTPFAHSVIAWLPAALSAGLMLLPGSADAADGIALRPDALACKAPPLRKPALKVAADDVDKVFRADVNGDGWCDHVVGVAYPRNSRMNAYYLNDLLALGGPNSWGKPFNGKQPFMLDSSDDLVLPRFRVDLTAMRLVYPAAGGAPYVLGLFAGNEGEGLVPAGPPGCSQYVSVHRWDAGFGAFKRADDATKDAVLRYFYSAVEQPCSGMALVRGHD